MSASFSFVVPGLPVPLARPRVYRRKGKVRTITPPKSASYEDRIRWLARAAMPRDWRTDGEFEVSILLVFKDGVHGDVDNCAKACLDALNRISYADDKQVAELHVKRAYDEARPRVEVVVTRIGDARPTKKPRAKAAGLGARRKVA